MILVRPARPDDEATLRAQYDRYIGDIVAVGASYARDAGGAWQPDYLSYWLAPGDDHHVLVIEKGPRAVGFSLILDARSPHIGPDLDFCLCEFYVVPEARERGVGTEAALAIFARLRGRWEVPEVPGNTRAIRFWRRVIGEHTGGRFWDGDRGDGPAQRFDNRVRGS